MSASTPLLGTILASFFNDHLKLQRGLRPNSITSYADAMRLLLQFAECPRCASANFGVLGNVEQN